MFSVYAFSFCVGILSIFIFSHLPPWWVWAGVTCIVLPFIKMHPYVRLIAIWSCGLFWSSLHFNAMLDGKFTNAIQPDQAYWIQGEVQRTLGKKEYHQDVIIHIECIKKTQAETACLENSKFDKIVLSLPVHIQWNLGDVRVFQARLFPKKAPVNQGAVDMERIWFFDQQLIQGRWVCCKQELQHTQSTIAAYQENLSQKIQQLATDPISKVILPAMILADTKGFTASIWEVLQKTGTAHLIAISGQHITLIMGAVFVILRLLLSQSQALVAKTNIPRLSAILTIAIAFGYVALSGFVIPAQRAFAMSATFMLVRYFLPFGWSLWDSLCISTAILFFISPSMSASISFWLSGYAMLLIIGFVQARRFYPFWQQMLILQLGLSVGMLPILAFFDYGLSLVSPLVNLIAVPWSTFILLPLSLLATLFLLLSDFISFFYYPASWLFYLCSQCMAFSWYILEKASQWPNIYFSLKEADIWALFSLSVAVILMILPRGIPLKSLGIIFLIPWWIPSHPEINTGDLKVDILDVGQGLSVLIQTKHHAMLYDAGPHWKTGDAGSRYILPFLEHEGVHALDMIVLSHFDLDHRGGINSILEKKPTQEIITLFSPEREHRQMVSEYPSHSTCLSGKKWQWDQVHFEFIFPLPFNIFTRNLSCVLKITTGKDSILLTGDIDATMEKQLLRAEPGSLSATVLLVPHHGSLTSSSVPFIAAVAPKWAVVSSGSNNRFGHPHPRIKERYQNQKITLLETPKTGSIHFYFTPTKPPQLETYRQNRGFFWHRPPLTQHH